ncbi:MAG: glutamate-5-semialdehyde dehydrogenase [Christensenellales bacterium]
MSVKDICHSARLASYDLAAADTTVKNAILTTIADNIVSHKDDILSANATDVAEADYLGKAMQDRLRLNDARIEAMAEGIRQIVTLPDPVGAVVATFERPNGLVIDKVRAPLGVVGVIYEARPNVTIDVAGLCIKSGNCVVLRGGKEAVNSNRALYKIVYDSIAECGFNPNIVGFIDDVTRQGTQELLEQSDSVDVIIPRGGDGLKKFVLANSSIPVIASAGGNCHIFVDESADLDMSQKVVYNAKMQRPSVCNALEQLLVHKSVASKFLPSMIDTLQKGGCKIVGCPITMQYGEGIIPATEDDYKKEHLDYELTVRVVDGVDEAIAIINANNTKHSDGIMSFDEANIDKFTKKVDSGCVYVNASTRFTDGFEFGFGAEIGISTQKLHARGPLGLEQLTSEKYIIKGQGQVRQ